MSETFFGRQRQSRGRYRAALFFCALVLVLGMHRVAQAQNSITVGSIAATPGQTNVVVPLLATTDTSLTGLDVVIEFPSALCGLIAASDVRAAGRAQLDPRARTIVDAEEALGCPKTGTLRIILDDFRGSPVIPAGEGPVLEWVLAMRENAELGSFPLSVRVQQARNGPASPAISTAPGALSLTSCFGDCGGDGAVSVAELIRSVNVALGATELGTCYPADQNHDGQVSIDELVFAVRNSLQGCDG